MADFKITLSPPTQNLTLKNTTINTQRIDKLNDIVEPDGDKIDGALLVYDAETDRYVLTSGILAFDEDDQVYRVSGGTF